VKLKMNPEEPSPEQKLAIWEAQIKASETARLIAEERVVSPAAPNEKRRFPPPDDDWIEQLHRRAASGEQDAAATIARLEAKEQDKKNDERTRDEWEAETGWRNR
jgi:hypothetical protein